MAFAAISGMVPTSAASLASRLPLTPQAQALVAPGQSPIQLAQTLAAQGMNRDAVSVLASGMQPKQGVSWAAASAKMVEAKLPPGEVKAAELAQSWTQGQATEGQLTSALQQTQLAGPGSWSAQAALWSQQGATLGTGAGATPLAPKAVEGAVNLAASVKAGALQVPATPQLPSATALAAPQIATPQVPSAPTMVSLDQLTPPQVKAMNDALAPFVQLGLKIAGGAGGIA